jgi:hypothetical protein
VIKSGLEVFPFHSTFRRIVADIYLSAGEYSRAAEVYALSGLYDEPDVATIVHEATALLFAGDTLDVSLVLSDDRLDEMRLIAQKRRGGAHSLKERSAVFDQSVSAAAIRATSEFRESGDMDASIETFLRFAPEQMPKRDARRLLVDLDRESSTLALAPSRLGYDPFSSANAGKLLL